MKMTVKESGFYGPNSIMEDILEELAHAADQGKIKKWGSYDIAKKERIQDLEFITLDLHEGPIEEPGPVIETVEIDIHYNEEPTIAALITN